MTNKTYLLAPEYMTVERFSAAADRIRESFPGTEFALAVLPDALGELQRSVVYTAPALYGSDVAQAMTEDLAANPPTLAGVPILVLAGNVWSGPTDEERAREIARKLLRETELASDSGSPQLAAELLERWLALPESVRGAK